MFKILQKSEQLCRIAVVSISSVRMPFYAVAKGHVPGIYNEWSDCSKQVLGFKGAQFKKFDTREEAEMFINQRSNNIVDKSKLRDETGDDRPAKRLKTNDHEAAASSDNKKDITSVKNKNQRKEQSSSSSDIPDAGYESAIRKKVLAKKVPSKEHFEVNDEEFVVVYTDGCCEFNGKKGARAGIGVFFGDGNPLNVSEPVDGRATNNTAEIQAITYALEMIKRAGFSKALVHTDSQFVINCMTSWMDGWKKKGWKKSDGSEVINKADLIDLDLACDGLIVKFNHVKGHSGLHGNEMADQLAKEGATRFQGSK